MQTVVRLFSSLLVTLLAFSLTLAGQQTGKIRHTGNAYLDHPISDLVTPYKAPNPSGLTIVPTFDGSITNDPDAARIEEGINAAISVLESHIQTPITVNILFVNVNNGLGSSDLAYGFIPYTQYLSDLQSVQARSTNDRRALATLPPGPNPPVGDSPNLALTFPLLRAIGEPVLGNNGGGFDSTELLNVSLMNPSRTGPQDPNKYDLQSVVLHETSEALGAGGGGSLIFHNLVGSLDLYRYSAAGVRSYTTDTTADPPYFSIDGGTTNFGFWNNVNTGADSGDWNPDLNGFRQVQDAFGFQGELPDLQLNIDTNEWIALDIVGHNLNAPAFINDLLATVNALPVRSSVKNPLTTKLKDVQQDLAANNPKMALLDMSEFDSAVKRDLSRGLLTSTEVTGQAKGLLDQSANIESIISGL